MKQYEITVTQLPEDPRLDKVIPLHLPELSRSHARSLIENGSVYVNRKRCQKNAKEMRVGDSIRILISDSPRDDGENFVFTADRIIYEDADIIVVNKPPYLPTHETIDTSRHHLVLALQEFLAKRDGKKSPKDVYLGVHHRLDRDTSGVLLFTKRKEANAAVAQAFQNREVQKTYYAVVLGEPSRKSFTIKSHIGPHPRNKRLFASVLRGGKYAETEVRVLETRILHSKKISLVEAKPLTGRTHQIRVHLSEEGLPILGDLSYGVRFKEAERLLLHAARLELLEKRFEAPLPEDFTALAFRDPQAVG